MSRTSLPLFVVTAKVYVGPPGVPAWVGRVPDEFQGTSETCRVPAREGLGTYREDRSCGN